ncbi:MAG: hypothetical protein JWN59_560 [Sphingomonas bacterium]|nr:hypothetical protein [Sphingomonas bacterium]
MKNNPVVKVPQDARRSAPLINEPRGRHLLPERQLSFSKVRPTTRADRKAKRRQYPFASGNVISAGRPSLTTILWACYGFGRTFI